MYSSRRVELYDPVRHGQWEIYDVGEGRLGVRSVAEHPETPVKECDEAPSGHAFAAEFHLRDYLVQHLNEIEPELQLFVDEAGLPGVEYNTPVGRIDIFAVDATTIW